MYFEFDLNKSDNNKNKHGIDFVEAQKLWNDLDLLEIPAKTTDEMRFQRHGCQAYTVDTYTLLTKCPNHAFHPVNG